MSHKSEIPLDSISPSANSDVLVPFALAQPSRAIHATTFSETLQPRKDKVKAFFEKRGMWASEGEITLPGPTWSWSTTHSETPLHTQATLNPPDWSPDSQDDEKPENTKDDETNPD
jgi:hypothetical protein